MIDTLPDSTALQIVAAPPLLPYYGSKDEHYKS